MTEVLAIRRKKPPSTTPGAIRGRRHRRRAKRGIRVKRVPIRDSDRDALDAHFNERLAREYPAAAAALLAIRDALLSDE